MKFRRIVPVGLLAILAACVSGAAISWACTVSAGISLSPASGGPGQAVAVTGANFTAGAEVSIRWNGSPAAVLATARASAQGAFTASITIPAGTPDTYTVVAVGPEGTGTAAYTITGGPSSGTGTTPAAPGSDSSRTTSGSGEAAAGRTPSGNSLSARGGFETRRGSGTPGPGRPAPSSDGVAADRPTGVIADESGDAVFADSSAAGAERRPGSGSKTSERSAAAGLWAGFDSPTSSFLGDPNGSPATGGSMPGPIVTLLALGLAAGLGGLGLAGARRRARARTGAASD